MSEKIAGTYWESLSKEDREELVRQVARQIAKNTGYRSRKEKAKARKQNGTLANTDPKAHRQKGNSPKTKKRIKVTGKRS